MWQIAMMARASIAVNDATDISAAAAAPAAAGRPFVGRATEMALLDDGLAAATAGRGSLHLIVGEAGIGKTRLANELARRAATRNVDVVWGRCWEDDAAPAYWPWIQILRSLAELRPADELRAALGNAAPLLAALAPELVAQISGVDLLTPDAAPIPSSVESERFRFRLFDAVTEFFRRAAASRPIVLLFDDLHTADLPSLLLLQFLARALPELSLLVVATQREADARIAQHGQPVFTALERNGARIKLRAWQRDEVSHYLEDLFDRPPPPRLLEVVCDVTGGNPLFVDGFARAVRDHADIELLDGYPVGLRIPDSVRAVIRDRLRPLPPDTARLLAAAAVIGRRFEVRVLAAVVGQPLPELVDRLAVAVQADILAVPAQLVGTYSFSHPLVRETVYADIAPGERLRLHHEIAGVLEQVYAERLDEHASEIAHHYFEAAFADDAVRAIALACRAAERAVAQCAYEEAAHLYRRALAALDVASADETLRCELMVALGEAHLQAGNSARAREICGEAALLARRLGAGALLARAALTFGGISIGPGIFDPELIGLLEESRRFLGPEPSALKAIVSARLAVRMHMPGDNARRASLCLEAVDAARLSANDEAMAHALDARHLVFWGQTDLAGQLAIADQLMGAADRCGNRELLLHGHQLRITDFLEMGDIDAVDLEIERYESLAGELRLDLYVFRSRVFRAMRATLAGDFARAERLAAEALDLGNTIQTIVAATYYGVQSLALERLRGRPGPAEANMLALLEAFPSVSQLRLALAALYVDFGRRDDAAAAFERVAPHDFSSIPVDNNWLVGAALSAEICAFIGDRVRGATVFDMLLPFAGRNAVGGSAAACNGFVSRQLGQLSALFGRPADAYTHLQDAIARDGRMGARPFVLRGKYDLAELLASEAGADAGLDPEPRQRSLQLAREVQRGATELGMERTAERAATLLARLDRPASAPG